MLMNARQTPVIGSAALLMAIGAIAVFVMRGSGNDVEVCRRVFQGLAEGRPGVHRRIDWERLKALDVDVGAAYAALPNDQERAGYRRAFIERFSAGFRGTGGSSDAFVRWRAQGRADDGRVVVAADYAAKQKTLLLRLSGGWNKKLVGIQWQ